MSHYRGYSSTPDWLGFTLLGAAFVAFCIFITFALGSFVGPGDSRHLLEKQGFTDVTLKSKDIWFPELRGCSNDDSVIFTFEATNVRNQRVSIQVCDGVIKGATVRG